MARIVRCGLIQAHCEWSPTKFSLAQIKEKMIAKHEKLIAAAAKRKVQILGLQELFYGPYFCAEQETEMVRPDRAGAGRPDRDAHAETGEEIWHGDGRSGL